MRNATLGLGLVLLVTGCAANSQAPLVIPAGTDRPDRAAVIVFRPQTLDHFARSPSVTVNQAFACDLPNGSAFITEVPARQTTVATALWDWPGTSRTEFVAEAGKVYYVRVAPNSDKRIGAILGGPIGVMIAESISDRTGPFLLDPVAAADAQPVVKTLGQVSCP